MCPHLRWQVEGKTQEKDWLNEKKRENIEGRREMKNKEGWGERTSAQRGSTEPYGCPLSEMQMTAGLLLRFLKQILTPAGADALSDSDTRLSSTTSFRCPLSKLDKWIILGERQRERKKNFTE